MSVNEELFYTLRRSNACLRRKHDGGSRCHGGSGRILDFLDESVGVSQQQLADTLCLRPQSVSEGICRLEQLGWILKKQSDSDRRQFLIFITEEGKLVAYNTDGIGFVKNLQEHGVGVQGKKIVLLGAGGAATAIAVQTALDGAADLKIFNIKDEFYANAEDIAAKLSEAVPACHVEVDDLANAEALKTAIADADILVNATKMGMKPLDDDSLIHPEYLRPDLVVADTVYNPRETILIKEAQKAGCKAAIGGIGMLLWQGVAAFKLYTGQDMPYKEVEEKFFAE